MTKIAFIDTETTSLRHDRRAWEIAVIVREPWTVKHPDDPDTAEARESTHVFVINHDDLDLGNADLMSLKIGGFHKRHPDANPDQASAGLMPERMAMYRIEAITRGAHLVGAVPSFDAEVLASRMRANGICPSWHHHLIDVEALAVGWLNGRRNRQNEIVDGYPLENNGKRVPGLVRWDSPGPWDVPLPWKSDDLSRLVGVEPPGDDLRHSALGDAMWARAIYDAITGGTP